MKEKLKNQNAITLIALVVTIVVLLILAGITINMVFSNNGVIKQAQEAKNVQENAEAKDREAVANLMEQANSIVNPVKKITITFNANGGTASATTIEINSGEAIGTLPTATKANTYQLKGWYLDGEKVTETTSFEEDTTLNAIWEVSFIFSINGNKTIYSQEGLTWNEWCESEYGAAAGKLYQNGGNYTNVYCTYNYYR